MYFRAFLILGAGLWFAADNGYGESRRQARIDEQEDAIDDDTDQEEVPAAKPVVNGYGESRRQARIDERQGVIADEADQEEVPPAKPVVKALGPKKPPELDSFESSATEPATQAGTAAESKAISFGVLEVIAVPLSAPEPAPAPVAESTVPAAQPEPAKAPVTAKPVATKTAVAVPPSAPEPVAKPAPVSASTAPVAQPEPAKAPAAAKPAAAKTAVAVPPSAPEPVAKPAPAPIVASTAPAAQLEPATKTNPKPAQAEAVAFSSVATQSVEINVRALVREAAQRNANAINDQLAWEISTEQTKSEQAVLEPEFYSSYTHQGIDEPNSTDKVMTRMFQAKYNETSDNYELGVKGLFKSGGQWSVSYGGTSKKSSIIKTPDQEFDNSLNLTFRQPFLKNRGAQITLAKGQVARINEEIAFHNYRYRIMEVTGGVIHGYWAYYGAQELCESWTKSLDLAVKRLESVQNSARLGKSTQTEVLEAESGVSKRQAELLSAVSDLNEARSRILYFLNLSLKSLNGKPFLAVEKPATDSFVVPELGRCSEQAFLKWPAALITQKKVEREDLQIAFSKNQVLPKLDFVSGYRQTSLEDSTSKAMGGAFSTEFPSWYTGLELSVPLGNQRAKSDLAMARLKKQQADLEAETIRTSIVNSLEAKITRLQSIQEQLNAQKHDVEQREKLLAIELEKLEAGKSSVRSVQQVEEDLLDTRRNYLATLLERQKAEAAVFIADGSLLEKYQIEITR